MAPLDFLVNPKGDFLCKILLILTQFFNALYGHLHSFIDEQLQWPRGEHGNPGIAAVERNQNPQSVTLADGICHFGR